MSRLGPEECPLCWRFDCKCWQLDAIVDRNGNRQDGETRLGPKDESGGAEGNRTRGIA